MEDELYNEIIMVLKDSTILGFGANDEKKYRGIRKFYTFRETSDGKITLIKNVIDKLRIVPRRRELPAIFNKYHDESGHASKNVLMRETMIGYFWPTKTVDIDAYVNNCVYCNEFKKRFGKAPSKRDRPVVLEETKGIIVPKRPIKRKSKEPASSKTKTTKTKSSKKTEEGPWGSILEKKKKDNDSGDSGIDSEDDNDNNSNDDSDNSSNSNSNKNNESSIGTKRLKLSKNQEDNHNDDEDDDDDDDNNDDDDEDYNDDDDDDYKVEEDEENEEENFKPKRLGGSRRQSAISSISDDNSEIL
ncbi:hypothetical protein ACTFIR_000265 [Dictyostelium discoideum]